MITGMSLVLGVVPNLGCLPMSSTSALQVVLAISLPDLADLANRSFECRVDFILNSFLLVLSALIKELSFKLRSCGSREPII